MSQKVAVIASVLKPVDDTRLYEKLGQTVAQTNKYRVNIIGFASKNVPSDAGVNFHPIFAFNRLSWARIGAPWKFLKMLWKLRPTLLIIGTPELLMPAVLYKIVRGGTLWFDVQENYQLNIRYQKVYPFWWRPLALFALWFIVKISKPFIDHYLLAEEGYTREMSFPKGKYTVLANKYQPPAATAVINPPYPTRFVLSGTISEASGVWQSIELIGEFFDLGHEVMLTVIGHAPDPLLNAQLQALMHKPYLQIITNGQPLPHPMIMKHLQQADYGIVSHQPDISNQNCVPTRLYELLGLKKPILLQKHSLWEAVAQPYNAALAIDFNRRQPQELWDQLNNHKFYTSNPGPEVTWAHEAPKLQRLLSN